MIEKLFIWSCRWDSLTSCFGRWRKWQICCRLFIDIVYHWIDYHSVYEESGLNFVFFDDFVVNSEGEEGSSA